MKTRNGLISNSSSASFIVAYYKKGEICNCCGRGLEDLEEKIRDLTKKYTTVLQVSPSASTQLLMLLEDYKIEKESREQRKIEAMNKDLGKDLDDLINIG